MMLNCSVTNINSQSSNVSLPVVGVLNTFDEYDDATGHTSNSSDSVDSVLCDVASVDFERQHASSLPPEVTWQASSSLFSDDADSMLSDVSKCLVSLSSGMHDDDDAEPLSESSSSTLERPLYSSNSVRRYSSL